MAKIKVHSYGAEKKKGANIKTTMPNNTGSGLGYVAGRIGTGVASVFEGTGKLIKGTAALLSGDELYAKYVFTKSQVGEWREALEEYYNPGEVMSFFGDVGEGVGQSSVMLADALTHFLGTGMFFAGIGGNSVGNAVSMTGNVGLGEYAYGLTVAGAEAALERYVGAGGRAVSNLIKPGAKSAAKSVGKAAAKRAARNGLLKNILYSGAGEFVEEFLGDFVDVTAQKMYSINKNAEYSLSNALYSGLVGFFSGAVMGGATQSAQAATYINAGSKVQRNGNVDSLLKQADLIAENFATMGGGKTERTQMNHYMKAIQASYDAYTALSEDAKMGTKGALYLGEMQGAMAGLQGAYGVENSKEYILSKAEKFADYASKREGKTYTVQDLLTNKDNILNNLAIEHFAGQFMTAPEYEQFERGIRDVIRKEGAAETAERITFEEMDFDPAEAKRATESIAYEDAVTMISESETWDGESDMLYKVPGAGYVYVRSHGDGSYTVGEGTAESYLSGDIIMANATEAEVREILAKESENAKEAPAEAEAETVTEEVAETEESQTSEEATSEESETEVKSAEEKKNSLRKKKEKAKETPAEQTEEDKARQKTRMERAQIQDRARKAVPDFDLQPVDVRTAIEAMYRSATENGASAEAADAAAHLIAVLGGTEIRFQKGIVANGLTDVITDNEGNKKRLILVNPRTDAEGGATTTLLHEVTHLLEGTKGYEQLSKIALENYANEKADELRQRYRDYAEKHGKTFSDEYLDQEVTAEAVGELLTKGKYIARLRNRAPIVNSITYLGRIMRGLIGKNRAAYDATRKLWMAFYKCLATNAVEARRIYFAMALDDDNLGEIYNEKGEPVADLQPEGQARLSLSTYETEGRTAIRGYLERSVKAKKMTAEESAEMLDSLEKIYETCKEFKDKYAPFAKWSDAEVVRDTHGRPVFSVVTPNGEYKMNLDFSLVCKKRRTLDAVFNLMAEKGILDDFELGQKSIVKINELIRKYGLETACSLCFVDAKRFRQANVADSFVSLYNELVISLVGEGRKGEIAYYNFVGDTTKSEVEGIHKLPNGQLDFTHIDKVLHEYGSKTVEAKTARYLKNNPEGRRLLLRGDFMSSEGFDAVKTRAPQVLKLYNSKKGTGGPKAAFGDVQYLNEIIRNDRSWTPEKAYLVGGVRVQSFSDYVPRMVFDYVQMVYDLAARKLPAHAYTKEAIFAKTFGLTGIKINLSLIPAIAKDGIAPGLDANGDYVWAGESFNFEEAKAIQSAEGYGRNCGTICVGVSGEHIRKLLADPNIRMVIPYHKSGLNPIVAHMNRIDQFVDYTGEQNTKDASGSKVSKDFNFNKELQELGDPKAVAEKYLSWCRENGYTEKFSDFSSDPNYYKLLIDFTVYDQNGAYTPQRGVKAVFPIEGNAFGSMKALIQEGLEADAVTEGMRDKALPKIVDEIQRTLPRTEAEIEEVEVEQATERKYSLSKADLDSLYTELNLLNEQDRKRAERWKQAEQQIVADEDYLAAIEEQTAAQTLEQKRAARRRLKAIEERYGIPLLVAEKSEIADRQKEIRAKIDELTKAAAEEAEAEGIRKSGKTAEDYHRSLAVKEFGYTSDFNEAGYLLPNGKLLNFSGEKGRHTGERGQDHRAIGIVYANTQGTAALIKFMGEGNIRIMAETPGLDVMQGVEPTAEQYSKIRAYAREMATRNFFNVDITDANGRTVGSLEYSGKVNPDRIVNDIKAYYQTGEIRKQSEIDRFRYSLPAKDVEYMTAVESGDMTSAQKMVDEAAKEAGYDSPLLYHGTQAFGFTEFDPAFSDDGISLFTTTSDRMAKTYSGKYGRRAISSASTVTNGDIQKALAAVNPKVMIAEGENLQKGVAAGIRSKIKDFENSASLSKLTVPAEYVQALNTFKNNRSAESIDRLAVLFTEEAIQTLWQNSGVALSARRIGKIASMLHSDVAFYVQQADGRVDVLSRDEAIRKARNKLEKLHGNYALYAKTENLFVLDCKGKNWNRLGYTHNGKVYHQTNDIAKLAKAEGYSGVLFKNLVDNGAHGPASGAGDVYVFFDGTQLKSADPVTYDAGNVIPLSERFNEKQKDIRYSLPESSEETVREREAELEQRAKREKARADRLQDELHAYKEYGYNAGDVYAIENDRSKEYNGRMDKNVRRRMLLKAKNGIEYLRKYPSAENANKVRGTVDRLIHDYAEEVIYNRKEEVDPQLKEMRSFMKSYRVSISEDLKGDLDRFGGYEAFRRQNMGRGLIMSKDGTPVETIYPELTAAFGEGVFPSSIKNPADQLIHISEMLKSGVKTDEYVDYEELVRYEERLIRSMLTDVSTDVKRNNRYNPVYNERMAEGYSAPVTTYYAPDGARGLLNATEELVNRWAEANGAVRRRVNGMREKLENEFLYQLNTAKQGELREAAEQMAADLMKASEFLVGAEKVEKINKKGKPYTVWEGGTKYTATKLPGADARALFDELTEEILSRAENEQYRVAGIITASQISAENAALKEEVASLKAQADLASKIKSLHDLAKGKTKPSEKIDYADLNAAVDELSKIVRKGRISPEKAQKFALWFENYLNSKSPTGTILYLRESIPEATREHLATFATLDAEQPGILDQFYLKVFSNLFYELRRAYDNYGMVKMDGEWKYAIDIAKDGVKQAQGSPLNVNRRKGWSKLFRPVKQFMLQAQDPLRTSMMLEGYADNGILSKLVFDVIMGEAERTSMQMDFLKKFEDFFKEHKGYQQKLATKMLKINAFEDSEGKPFEMTLGEAMSFVGLSKREQAKAGLANSDIFFENDEEGTRMVEGGWKRWADMDAEQRISALTGGISEITKQLEQEDMEFFKMVEEFFNKESSAVKRRSDLDYFGHEMAMEEYYFPIYRDSATLSEEVADAAKRMQNFITVSNQSFNKATMKNAQKSLFIANVYDVVTRHATGLATYATLYRPVLNFNTIWNQQTSGNKNSPESMRSVYKRTVWDGIDAYMRNLFDTVQGVTPPKGVLSKIVSKVRGNAVFYQLGINPKTWLTQITSLIASLDVLTVDSLTYGVAHGRAANDEVMDKHSVFARTRDYNMEVAKAEGVEGKIHKVGELSMKPISAVDRMVIRRLWAACQKQVMDTEGHPIGSEENNVAAGKLLDQAILRTQQTAGASTKSGFQRGSELEKSLVMFSSDAMKLLSTLTERIMRNRKYRTDVKNGVEGAQEKLTESNKALRKSAAAVVGVSLMIAMIAQLFKWIYDRDRRKKKNGTEVSVATDVALDSVGNLVGILPLIREVYDYMDSGYEVTDFTLDAFNEIIGGYLNVFETAGSAIGGDYVASEDIWNSVRQAFYSTGMLLGIPVRNANNAFDGFVLNLGVDSVLGTNTHWQYQALFKKPSYQKELDQAIEEGDTNLAELILTTWLEKEKVGEVGDELDTIMELYTKGYDFLPASAPSNLDRAGRTEWMTSMQEAQQLAAQMILSGSWQSMSEEAKAASLKKLYRNRQSNLKSKLLGEERTKDGLLAELYGELPVAEIRGLASVTETVEDENGNKTTKREQLEEPLSKYDGEEAILWYLADYSSKEAKRILAEKVNQIATSEEEKQELYKLLGIDPEDL